jgi:signal transduction histidine kinase
MLKRLRIKFICINMFIVAVMLSVIFGLVFYFTKSNLEDKSIQMMQEVAERPIQPSVGNDRRRDEVMLPYFIVEITPRGQVVTYGGEYYDLTDEEFLTEILTAAFSSENQIGVIDEYSLRYYRNTSSPTQMIVFADISSEMATLDNLTKTCVLIGFLSVAVFFLLSLALAHWTVKPVEKAWSQQKQFVADASHELKTPLTVIMTNAELLQSPDCDELTRPQLSDSIVTMAHQMRGLVESLLELARVDNGGSGTSFEVFDFSKEVSDAILPFEPIFFEKGLNLESSVVPDIMVNGNKSQLRQVFDILLDNAQKYSSPNGDVFVKLSRKNRTHCTLMVQSPGEEIPQEELKKIFDRFYRLDKARAMDHSYGLGLSIAKSIVERHNGNIRAESGNGRNTFYVELPTI